MAVHRGSCHCGAVTFEVEAEIGEVYQCDCSLCRRKNALMAAVDEGQFKLLSGADSLRLYQWNKKIAKHYFCGTCGIYTHHARRSVPGTLGINTGCLEDIDGRSLPCVLVHGSQFD